METTLSRILQTIQLLSDKTDFMRVEINFILFLQFFQSFD